MVCTCHLSLTKPSPTNKLAAAIGAASGGMEENLIEIINGRDKR
jgi:hypothetical protein